MLKNIQLRIDTPCSANWDQMTIAEQGRHCSSCKKTVVDFTGMSDQQVLNWFSRPHDSVCGRLENNQRRNSRPGMRSYLLAGLLVSSEASAQDKPVKPPVNQQDSGNADIVARVGKISVRPLEHSPERELPDTFRGRLIDSSSGLPVCYATITIDSNHVYSANDKGYFTIVRKNLSAEHTLKISAPGYKVLTIDVTKTWADDQQAKVLLMSPSEHTLTGMVAIGRPPCAPEKLSFLKKTLAGVGRIFR